MWWRVFYAFCGVIAAGVALAIMLADAIETGIWTINQFAMGGIAVVVVFAGIVVETAILERRWLSALGSLLFLIFGMLVSVWFSVARQGETASALRAQVDAAEKRRAQINRTIDETRNLQYQAEAKLLVCTGTGCERINGIIGTYKSAIEAEERKLHALPKPRVVDGDTAQVVDTLAMFGVKTTRQTAEALKQISLSLLFEIAAVLAFGLAFRPRGSNRGPNRGLKPRKIRSRDPRSSDNHGQIVDHGDRGSNVVQIPLPKSHLDQLRALALNHVVDLNQRQLAVRLGVSRATLRELLAEWSKSGLIQVETTKQGTTIRIIHKEPATSDLRGGQI